jgi:uncharacterized protein
VNIPASHLAQLPLFPLQSVLFPDGLLPLRIFEVRYLDMIGKCHKAGTPFGVVCLTQGSEVRRRDVRQRQPSAPVPGRPAGEGFAVETFQSVGTLAAITVLERPQAGLMMVRCTGTQRFLVRSSRQLPHGLWVADVALLGADPALTVPDDLAHTRDALQQLLLAIERQMHGTEMPLQGPYRWDDCGWLANRWCELLPLGAEVKQRFMSLDSPLLRLELVADALDQMGFKLPPEA